MEDKAVENYIEHMNNNYATKEELQDRINKITEYCEQLKVDEVETATSYLIAEDILNIINTKE